MYGRVPRVHGERPRACATQVTGGLARALRKGPRMTDSKVSSRKAQDTLVLLGLTIAGFALVVAGALLPIPMLGLIGLPLGLGAGLIYAFLVLGLGGFEVPWWRQLGGLGLAFGAFALLFYGYLHGLGTIAEHFLDRRGAPPLSDLWVSVGWLGAGVAAVSGSIVARRKQGGLGPAITAGVISALTAGLGWGLLVVLAILGVPLGA